MSEVFSSIYELRQIREKKKFLSIKEMELLKPKLTDYTLIPKIKSLYEEYVMHTNGEYSRKKLIFIILFLFSQASLLGARSKKGVRRELSKIFPEIRPCSISNDISSLQFIFFRYHDFRTDVENAYEYIMKRLTE